VWREAERTRDIASLQIHTITAECCIRAGGWRKSGHVATRRMEQTTGTGSGQLTGTHDPNHQPHGCERTADELPAPPAHRISIRFATNLTQFC